MQWDIINRLLDLGESALGLCWNISIIWVCIFGGILAIGVAVFFLAWIVGLIILIIEVILGIPRESDSKDRNA